MSRFLDRLRHSHNSEISFEAPAKRLSIVLETAVPLQRMQCALNNLCLCRCPFYVTDLTLFKTSFYHFPKTPSSSEGDHYQDSLEVSREQSVLGMLSLILGSHSLQSMTQREQRRREDGPAPQSPKFSAMTRCGLLWNQGYKV